LNDFAHHFKGITWLASFSVTN